MTQGLLSQFVTGWKSFWGQSPCTHPKVTAVSHGSHCPDCGQNIAIAWRQLLCTGCNSKRLLKHGHTNAQALETHCRHCGESSTTWVTKAHIQPYEILYSVVQKQVAHTEQPLAGYTYAQVEPPEATDGTVIYSSPQRREFFTASPYTWTTDSRRPLRALVLR